jgi:hypothetical protein
MDPHLGLIAAFAAPAVAQEAPAPPPAPAPDDIPPPSEEIVVYGRLAIELARDSVIHEMERFGYRVRSREDGRTILAPPEPWMGAAVLEADGTLTFRNPVFAVGVPSETWSVDPRYEDPNTAIAGATDRDVQMTTPMVADVPGQPQTGVPGSIMIGGTTSIPSKRKRDAVRAQMLRETDEELEELRNVLRATEAADRGAGP